MEKYNKIVIIIPALNPDIKLLDTAKGLIKAGFSNMILVNDGSNLTCQPVFDAVKELFTSGGGQIKIIKHSINLGQGRAYKSALNYYLCKYSDGSIIECDADGQHRIKDIVRCADLLLEHPDHFILGVRNFNEKGIPFRSRFGNKCTNLFFRFFCGINIRDTQTGLKGIPYSLVKYLIEAPGERYEYATSVLLEVNKRSIPIYQFDIETIYINNNESSHFNPILDSIRIYSLLLKYMLASLSAFIIDIVMFAFFVSLYSFSFSEKYIVLATYSSKILSCSYSYIINKKLVFETQGKHLIYVLRFVLLCIVQASISALLVTCLFRWFMQNEVLTKVVVDAVLFFFSFKLQQRWVFQKKK